MMIGMTLFNKLVLDQQLDYRGYFQFTSFADNLSLECSLTLLFYRCLLGMVNCLFYFFYLQENKVENVW